MTTFLTVVQILVALLTPVIAVIAIWIAYQQWKTAGGQYKVAQDKLKLDLFDRRYKVYLGLIDFISVVNADGKPPREAFGQFYQAISPAQFLFSDDICVYLRLVRQKAVDLRQAINTVAKASADKCETIPHEELMKTSAVERDLVGWFYDQSEVAGQKFLAALDFKKAL